MNEAYTIIVSRCMLCVCVGCGCGEGKYDTRLM